MRQHRRGEQNEAVATQHDAVAVPHLDRFSALAAEGYGYAGKSLFHRTGVKFFGKPRHRFLILCIRMRCGQNDAVADYFYKRRT